jgi:hypothetical protein
MDSISRGRSITIKGTGHVSVAPDLIVIDMTITVSGMDHETCIRESGEQLGKLREAIVNAGHEGNALKTGSFMINTKYESYRDVNDAWKQRFAGYECTHKLSLRFDLCIHTLSLTLGAITKCGVNPAFQIRFAVNDQQTVTQKLLQNAIADAVRKAEVLAEAAGLKLGEIHQIHYNWSDINLYSGSEVEYGLLSVADSAASVNIEIDPEDVKLSENVTVILSIHG